MGPDNQPTQRNQGGADPLDQWSDLLLEYGHIDPEYQAACKALHSLIHDRGMYDTFSQLAYSGPVWDGNLISKKAKKVFVHAGLAERVIVEGEDGYTTITARGLDVANTS